MASTKITFTLSPEEYAFIRRALSVYTAQQTATAKDSDTDSKMRREAQTEAVRGDHLLSTI